MIKNIFKFLLILVTIIICVKADVYSQHYNIDTSSYIEGNDILSEFDIEYMLDYEKWGGCFRELAKYLRPEYVDVWNDVEGVDFYYVYRRSPAGSEGLGINPESLIKGTFGYYGVLHSAMPYSWYTPEVYKFKNLIDKLKKSEDKLRYKRYSNNIIKMAVNVKRLINNASVFVRKKLFETEMCKFETIEFGTDKFGYPLQWIILDNDENKHEYLLLLRDKCDNILEDQNGTISWNQSKIREFLNNEFYEKSFTDNDKKLISSVALFDEYLNEDINDKVFILSYDEVKKYLYNDEHKLYNFDWLISHEWDGNDVILKYSYNNKLYERHSRDIFTLRNYGYGNQTFASIDIDGKIYPFETYIHPAMWVKYK